MEGYRIVKRDRRSNRIISNRTYFGFEALFKHGTETFARYACNDNHKPELQIWVEQKWEKIEHDVAVAMIPSLKFWINNSKALDLKK